MPPRREQLPELFVTTAGARSEELTAACDGEQRFFHRCCGAARVDSAEGKPITGRLTGQL